MKPKKVETRQGRLFEVELATLIKPSHDLVKLSKKIDWNRFEQRLEELYVDTTVQEKNISYPSEANLLNRARAKLVKLCEKHHIVLRQKYTRVGKRYQIKAHRYAQASQWNRCRRMVRKLRTILGRIL